MRVAMQKTAGVGDVTVSLNDGLTTIDLKPGNAITIAQLRRIIKDNGFVSREARMTARGAVSARGADLVFTVAGTGETFVLSPAPAGRAAFDDLQRRARSGAVAVEELTGTASPPVGSAPARIAIESVM